MAGTLLFASCGSDNNSTANTATKESTTTEQSSAAKQDTATNTNTTPGTNTNADNGLMGSMNGMMNRMQSMKMSGDFDTDWANMMIEHHQGAIDMAQVEVSQGKNEKLKAKAQEIMTKQKAEQQQLRDIVQNMKPSNMKMGEGELPKAMSTMMDKMKSMSMSGDVDKDFATMMIAHHQSAIDMSKMELKNGMSAELKKIARKAIDDQQKDISEFKNLMNSQK